MEELYLQRIHSLENKIKELTGESDEATTFFPEPEDCNVKLKYNGEILIIEYQAFDELQRFEIDPFINHNVPDFIAACINYFRWDNALYEDTEFSESIDIEDEVIRYKNFKAHP